MKENILLIVIICLVVLSLGSAHAEDKDIAKIFNDFNINGTIIISSLDGKTIYSHNNERSLKGFLPASTFKIPNTLIALDESAISDENEVIKWDGKDRGWSSWNKDHSLKSAFPVSCVWFYQELAKRIGNKKYLYHLDKLKYGNRMTGPELTKFWLKGDIRISASDQINFLKKLHKNDLPYKDKHINILKKIMVVDKKAEYTIRAKTGWAVRIEKQHGWYVGYVETKKEVWFFATNIDIKSDGDAAFRKKITMKVLKLKGII